MEAEKVGRRIEISLRYGDPLTPKIKARKYKWDPAKKVWWKGYTEEEMTWAQEQEEAKRKAAARFAERRKNAVELSASYQETEPVKEDLLSIGCFLDSTGKRVFSQRKGEYVFSKAWYAPSGQEERARAIIEHGGASQADAAAKKLAEGKALAEAINERVRAALIEAGVPSDTAQTASIGSWSADFRFGSAWVQWGNDNVAVAVHDSRSGEIFAKICGKPTGFDSLLDNAYRIINGKISAILTSEQLPEAQAAADKYGRTATGIRRNLIWHGSVSAQVGDVIHTKTAGWALVVDISSDRIGWSDIEEREDRDDFGGRQTPGVETYATVIPVEPAEKEKSEKEESDAKSSILSESRYQRAAAADDYRVHESDAYRLALENKRRLEAGESPLLISRKK